MLESGLRHFMGATYMYTCMCMILVGDPLIMGKYVDQLIFTFVHIKRHEYVSSGI